MLGYEDRGEHVHYSGQPSPEAQPGPAEPPARLLGPGMPGAPTSYPSQGYRQVHPPPASAPATEPRFSMGPEFTRIRSPLGHRSPRMHNLPAVRPATSQPPGWRERDPSRTLPPLVATRQTSSSYGSRRIYSSGAHPYSTARPTYAPRRSLSPEPVFAHHPPELVSRSHMNIPPPFTLQPHPQWDESSYLPRPSSSSWSRPGSRSTRGRSTSPITLRREQLVMGSESPASYAAERGPSLHRDESSPRSIPPASTPPSRSGRYDPIRALIVPYSTPSVSPTMSQARISGGGGDGDGSLDQRPPPSLEDR